MSDRKRKAAICCLIAASFLAVERRKKKRKREERDEYGSKLLNSTMDADNPSDYDDEEVEDEDEDEEEYYEEDDYEEEEEEEENYETPNSLGLAIKIEPGLTDEDSIAEYDPLEDVRDPLDTMIDIDSTSTIKQEKDYNNENSLDGGIKIKVEPHLSDVDINDVLSQNCEKDSNEGNSQSKGVSVDIQKKINKLTTNDEDQENKNVEPEVKNPNDARDDCQVFGAFVAGELRNLKSEANRKKLKRIIQKVIIEISESED